MSKNLPERERSQWQKGMPSWWGKAFEGPEYVPGKARGWRETRGGRWETREAGRGVGYRDGFGGSQIERSLEHAAGEWGPYSVGRREPLEVFIQRSHRKVLLRQRKR